MYYVLGYFEGDGYGDSRVESYDWFVWCWTAVQSSTGYLWHSPSRVQWNMGGLCLLTSRLTSCVRLRIELVAALWLGCSLAAVFRRSLLCEPFLNLAARETSGI